MIKDQTTRGESTPTMAEPNPVALQGALGWNSLKLFWLAGDGSDRCYYRVQNPATSESFVFMQLGPAELESLVLGKYDWVLIEKELRANNIKAPKLVHSLPAHGGLLIEDYGDQMLESVINNSPCNDDHLLQSIFPALDILIQFQNMRPSVGCVWQARQFDRERFIWEFNFFFEQFLCNHLGLPLTTAQKKAFDNEAKGLSELLSKLTQVFTHRDFHSRNIMVCNQKHAVIDFQDARMGPACYDFVSIVFDSYLNIPAKSRETLKQSSLDYWKKSAVSPEIYDETVCFYPHMLVQRQFKAIGSFAYLTHVKKKKGFLKYVNPALSTIEAIEQFPFLSFDLVEFIQRHHGN